MSVQNLAESTICVVGPSRRQNQMMASFLERATDAHCLVGDNDYDIPHQTGGNQSQPRLILWDCEGSGVECLAEYETRCGGIPKQDIVLFIDLTVGLGIEEDAIHQGVRGFFYESDPLEKLSKCLQTLLTGQLWVSRKILADAIRQKDSLRFRPSKKVAGLLSEREAEILNWVTVGATNREIAEKLSISRHTVKTHMYNIYRKINVPNRLQAMLWAGQHL